MSNTCDYFGCKQQITSEEAKSTHKSGMRFCEQHLKECVDLIKANNVAGLLSFWVRANGGAKRLAKKF